MTTQLQSAYENIPVPIGLEQRVLAACLAQEKPAKAAWRLAPAVSLAACAGVLLVSLAASGSLDGLMTRVEEWMVGPGEEMFIVQPGVNQPVAKTTTAANSSTTLSTSSTTASKNDGTTGSPQTTVTQGTNALATSATSPIPMISGSPQACMRKLPGDYESMTLSELTAYFGRRIQPAWLPEDMQRLHASFGFGVWHRNEEEMQDLGDFDKKQFENGTYRDAEVIYDQNVILYQGEDDRELFVAMSTAPYPRNMLGDMSRFDEDVTVAGVAAKLAYYDDSAYGGQSGYSYTVLFTVDGVEFKVNGWNLPRQEFLKVVESIIE